MPISWFDRTNYSIWVPDLLVLITRDDERGNSRNRSMIKIPTIGTFV